MKCCSRCGLTKPLSDFYVNKRSPDGHRPDCRECIIALRKHRLETDEAFRAKQLEWQGNKVKAERKLKSTPAGRLYVRDRYLRKTYGVSLAEFEAMLATQDARCAICRADDPGKTWCVDHDHASGRVRQILCWNCNVGLGHFRDNPEILAAAIAYLRAHAQVPSDF